MLSGGIENQKERRGKGLGVKKYKGSEDDIFFGMNALKHGISLCVHLDTYLFILPYTW